MFSDADHRFMSRALELAAKGLFTTTPNPRVGCVIVKDGQVVAEGWHRRAGEPHAEALALAQAGGAARGATVYVTLEPCAHTGRTPPCADALVQARVGRVIAAMEDPNPQVAGRGLERLRAAGIDVRCGLLGDRALELNVGFVSRMSRGRPWVRMKIAASLDGMTALSDGSSQWITGDAARADGHAWRARACAVLTGIGTVRTDDPTMNVRSVPTTRQPLRIVIDSRLEIDRGARILQAADDAGATLLLAGLGPDGQPPAEALARARGLEVQWVPCDDRGKNDLAAALQLLGARGLNEIHVEAGYKLNGSLLRAGLVDELLVYIAPRLLGQGQGMADIGSLTSLSQSIDFDVSEMKQLGPDLRLRLLRRAPAMSATTLSGTL